LGEDHARLLGKRAQRKAYCESAGFHESRYYHWQKKLREAAYDELARIQGRPVNFAPAGFMEVKVAAQNTFQTVNGSPQNQVCIDSTGVRIAAGGDYPVNKLVALVREVTLPCRGLMASASSWRAAPMTCERV